MKNLKKLILFLLMVFSLFSCSNKNENNSEVIVGESNTVTQGNDFENENIINGASTEIMGGEIENTPSVNGNVIEIRGNEFKGSEPKGVSVSPL